MPIETTWTAFGVEWRHWGVIAIEEINRVNTDFASDPRSDEVRYQLIDLSAVEALPVLGAELEAVGSFDWAQSLSTPYLKIAIVVPDDRFDDVLASYERALEQSSWSVRKFMDIDAARAWAQGMTT